ncbi:endolytic transglycosylase MltG [Candidatus Fermentibacteria bacterium]|nr:endolytic transglycosylase MltG [Candidatus Fermentibacteria bacterium]
MKRAFAVLAVLMALTAACLAALRWISRPPGGSREVVFGVEPGWSARRITSALEDSGLVRSSLYALWRAHSLGLSDGFQAGRYLLDSSMSPDSILRIIARGDVIPVPTHWVTLPEGLTLEEALTTLSSSLDMPRAELSEAVSDRALLDSLGLPGAEGYLFPETYEIADSLTAREVLERLVSTFESRWEPSWDTALADLGLSRHEAVILASIVEREARLDEERPVVAGVFLRRLRLGMRLESCATVQYALGGVRERLSFADTRIESPWNTYLHEGLPPGPICSPGTSSLAAVAYPDTSQGYLFFVSRGDGSGAHLFASTLSGHQANIRLARSGVTH